MTVKLILLNGIHTFNWSIYRETPAEEHDEIITRRNINDDIIYTAIVSIISQLPPSELYNIVIPGANYKGMNVRDEFEYYVGFIKANGFTNLLTICNYDKNNLYIVENKS